MAGQRGRRDEPHPVDPVDPVAALARQVERQGRRQALQEQLLGSLSSDVAQLVTQLATKRPPPPTSWLSTAHPQAAQATLTSLTRWVGEVYLWYPGARLPTCWLWHPAAVEELWCLAQAHHEAYHPPTTSVGRASEFHERSLPGVLRRLAVEPYKSCDLSRHTPGGDRHVTAPDPVPLPHARHRIATAWTDGHQLPPPTSLEIHEAHTIDDLRTKPPTHN